MKMKKNAIIALLIVSSMYLFSCKGKDGAPGPTGTAGTNGVQGPAGNATAAQVKDGYAKGTLSGTTHSGITYSYDIDFEGVGTSDQPQYAYFDPTYSTIYIYKYYAGQGNTAFTNGYVNIQIKNVTSLSNLSGAVIGNGSQISITKDNGNNVIVSPSIYYYSGSTPSTTGSVSNLSYNATTGILTGNFTLGVVAGTYSGAANLTGGTFSAKIYTNAQRLAK